MYFPLHPETPAEGRRLEELFAGRNADIPAMMRRLKALMDQEGLPFNDGRNMTYNSRLAQELAKWADARPEGALLHTALYQAYFVDRKNIGDLKALLSIAKQVGLPVDEARRVLEQRVMRKAVDGDWDRARELGVTAVPTFAIENVGIVGAQPYEQLARLLKHVGASKRSSTIGV